MAKSLSVLFTASEIYPFVKDAGLADVAYSLPLALKDLGNDVRVMLPKYGNISERKNRIHDINRLRDMPVPINGDTVFATIKSSSIQNSRTKVQSYITTNTNYFDALKGVCCDPKTWEEYENNDERFIFFCRSVVETCVLLNWFPDIIHANDWQTALIPALAKVLYPKQFAKTKFVLTIHSLEHQGEFPWSKVKLLGIPEEEETDFKFKNKLNFVKAGIKYADYVTASSETFANDLMNDKDISAGLNTVFKSKRKEFKGILSGIDKWTWNPEKDSLIKAKYESDFDEYKYHNKVEVINLFGFEYQPKTPLIGFSSDFTENRGMPEFLDSLEEILKDDVQVAVLVKKYGDKKHKTKLDKLVAANPEKLKVKYGYDDIVSHQMKAGCDMFLFLNDYEPAGTDFMQASTYGSVPIAKMRGGISESIETYSDKNTDGFVIGIDKKKGSIVKSVKEAVNYFKDKDTWTEIARNGMYEEFSWDENAKEYDNIYRNLLKT